MEQKIIEVGESFGSLAQQRDAKIAEMNAKGFRLVWVNTIPAKSCPSDAHGVSYSQNEKMQMLFEK